MTIFKPQGTIPALVTPLDRDGNLLEDGLKEVLDFVIAGGVHGVFVLGSSGEIYGLSTAQKRRVIEVTVEHVGGRVPIYAGASEITTRDCIATAQMAQAIGGVSALSVLTPYFMTPNQTELVAHFEAIARATDLPVILYTNPGRTQVNLTVPTVQELSRIDNIVAIKDSSGDMTLTADLIADTDDDFSVLVGRDTLIYAALCHGATGAIASTANVAPATVAGIYNAFQAGDLTGALTLQRRLSPLRHMLDRATFPVVLKEALRLKGVNAGWCLAPARELTDALRPALAAIVATLD
ncbi:MAG: 4-hydroxy-tetrahydrodipicolinate synthase [Propionibacteriaceae bacterium]|nr:4-hydroxy-tetrahydrodipicolinate synthase [Propionibacteriaceae bacterium]